MKIINQGDSNQCFLYSFAMLLDKTPEHLQHVLGATGKEIIFPNLPEPYCFRSFHPNDFICYVAVKGGSLTTYEVNPLIQGDINEMPKPLYTPDEVSQRFAYMIGYYSGVFISGSHRHAAAWNSEESRVYDPSKGVVSLAWWVEKYGVDHIYLLTSPLTRV